MPAHPPSPNKLSSWANHAHEPEELIDAYIDIICTLSGNRVIGFTAKCNYSVTSDVTITVFVSGDAKYTEVIIPKGQSKGSANYTGILYDDDLYKVSIIDIMPRSDNWFNYVPGDIMT